MKLVPLFVCVALLVASPRAQDFAALRGQLADFVDRRCAHCHDADSARGGIDFDAMVASADERVWLEAARVWRKAVAHTLYRGLPDSETLRDIEHRSGKTSVMMRTFNVNQNQVNGSGEGLGSSYSTQSAGASAAPGSAAARTAPVTGGGAVTGGAVDGGIVVGASVVSNTEVGGAVLGGAVAATVVTTVPA